MELNVTLKMITDFCLEKSRSLNLRDLETIGLCLIGISTIIYVAASCYQALRNKSTK